MGALQSTPSVVVHDELPPSGASSEPRLSRKHPPGRAPASSTASKRRARPLHGTSGAAPPFIEDAPSPDASRVALQRRESSSTDPGTSQHRSQAIVSPMASRRGSPMQDTNQQRSRPLGSPGTSRLGSPPRRSARPGVQSPTAPPWKAQAIFYDDCLANFDGIVQRGAVPAIRAVHCMTPMSVDQCREVLEMSAVAGMDPSKPRLFFFFPESGSWSLLPSWQDNLLFSLKH